MSDIGLALSGGGFRATLYHLGVVRLLRDASLLPSVSHITSVSGGSIFAAHLVLNWERYNGSVEEFEEVAAEILRFVQLDVRNRILRRYPLGAAANGLRRLVRARPRRLLTRTGLLESYYRDLFGDTCLFELPSTPQLHILATNLSEGCLCSFTRSGLISEKRLPGHRSWFDRVHLGFATVPMAVAASSAFPGFFPPLELRGSDVGASEGEFGRQFFTDGGVFDNLGIRMLRCIEESWISKNAPLRRRDLLNLEAVTTALQKVRMDEVRPVARLARLLARGGGENNARDEMASPESGDRLVQRLWDVIVNEKLYMDPSFESVTPGDPDARSLAQFARSTGRELDWGDHLWLNRQLVAVAFEQEAGEACIRPTNTGFKSVIISDAGKKLQVIRKTRAGGLVGTAIRASDILMDRVWQLENEIFGSSPGFTFAWIGSVVEPSEDETALHPEVQRQVARIRTDLDRFSPLEISGLIRHGYCVARSACRSNRDLVEGDVPGGPPWDPLVSSVSTESRSARRASGTVVDARRLHTSTQPRFFRGLLDLRDWTTYLYVPLILLLLVAVPWTLLELYKKAEMSAAILDAISESSPDHQKVLDLLRLGSVESREPLPVEDVVQIEEPDYEGFEFLSDTHIVDLRNWMSGEPGNDRPVTAYVYRRLRVQRKPGPERSELLRLHFPAKSTDVEFGCPDPLLRPTLRLWRDKAPGTLRPHLYELELVLDKVPVGEPFDVINEITVHEGYPDAGAERGWLERTVFEEMGVANMWILLPRAKPYATFQVVRYEPEKPETVEAIQPTEKILVRDGSVIGWKIANPKPHWVYACRWTLRE